MPFQDQWSAQRIHVPFDDLPVAGETGLRHAWDHFEGAATPGTVGFLTPARRLAALASVRTGESIGLNLPLDRPDPPPLGRSRVRHEVYALNGFSWDDRLTNLDLQASTQWDGLLHVGHREVGLYGGHADPRKGASALGIHRWASEGIVGRGVLVDLPAYFASRGEPYSATERVAVGPKDVKNALDKQGTDLGPGDVLCLRFGWHESLATRPAQEQVALLTRPICAGLSATEETARYLWDHEVAAVVTDNPTVEVQPGDKNDGFLHQRLLTMLGMPLGELFDLDALARACERRGAWDFLFSAVPLNLTGGVGSPGNAIALI